MKLSKLYCNHKDFKNITFKLKGLNVVYADVTDVEKKQNSHCLGKTRLAQLIDFMFLKKIDKKHFLFKKKEDNQLFFEHHIFYLEILLNNDNFLTIKRGVKNNTKISFSINENTIKEYTPPNKWNYADLPLPKAKDKFSKYISLDFFANKKYDYRKAINYCLRTPPQDYADVYKLSKFRGKDIHWKPFIFDLLGFDGDLLVTKYENDKKREDILEYINSLKKDFSIKVEDRDDYVARMQALENEVGDAEKQIDRFNFYKEDKTLIKKGSEDIELKISTLNSKTYNLKYEIDQLRSSIKNNFAFDINKVEKIFNEVKLHFPVQIKKDYKDLLIFNYNLTSERNKLIRETLKKKEKELNESNIKLKDLNAEREELLSYIQDTDSFRKFKYYQKKIIAKEAQLTSFREKIKNIDNIIAKEKEREDLLKEIEVTVGQIRDIYQHTENNKKYSEIRKHFSFFYKKIMNEDARISWSINDSNNVDFIQPKVHSKDISNYETAKDAGTTYKKLLCIVFDLTIACVYNNESYFRFLYHDDALSQQDKGIKNRLLKLVDELSNKFNLQYIISAIESDLPYDGENKIQHFNDEDIILLLHGRDLTGTLFGIDF